MPRSRVWLPGMVLLVGGLAALLYGGAFDGPADQRSTPRVVVRDVPAQAPVIDLAHRSGSPREPEVVVLGEVAPARWTPAPRSAGGPRVVHEIVYVDAPLEEPTSSAEAYRTESPPAVVAAEPVTVEPVEDPTRVYVPPAAAPETERGPSRAGAIATGAAIGAGIGAVLGGGRGALRGAIGGAAGGAIGGRSGAVLGGVLGGAGGRRAPRGGGCFVEPGQDLVSVTPGIGAAP